jgi:hypothetical protein
MHKRWERIQRVILTGGLDELNDMHAWCATNGYKVTKQTPVYRHPLNPEGRVLTVLDHMRVIGERSLGGNGGQ